MFDRTRLLAPHDACVKYCEARCRTGDGGMVGGEMVHGNDLWT